MELSPLQLQALIQRTDPQVLRDRRLLRLFFTHPLSQAPDYLAAILQHLEVHVNFMYQDPLRILLSSIYDVLSKVNKPAQSRCAVRKETVYSSNYLQSLSPHTFEEALVLPLLYDDSVVHWREKGRALVRPPETASSGSLREDGLLLSNDELETFFSNSRRFLDVLLEYGLGQERLEYLHQIEGGQYLAPLLQLFRVTSTPRIRRFAIDYAFQLVPLGIDLYHDLFFQTVHDLLRDGSVKTADDCSLMEENLSDNFDKITDLLTFWLQAGFDINYQYAKPLIFAERHGVATNETATNLVLSTVHYTSCSVLALAVIYNRADVVSWILQFCGIIPIESVEEENLFPRVLDVSNPVGEVQDDVLIHDEDYLTILAVLRSSGEGGQCESNIMTDDDSLAEWNIFQLARRHRSTESEKLLVEYSTFTSSQRRILDPLQHNIRQIVYENYSQS